MFVHGLVIFTVSSVYFAKDVLFSNHRAHQSAIVFAISTFLWWAIYTMPWAGTQTIDAWLCASVGLLYGMVLLFFGHSDDRISLPSRRLIIGGGGVIWGFFLVQVGMVFLGYPMPIPLATLMLVVMAIACGVMGLMWFVFSPSPLTLIWPKVPLKWASILSYLAFLGAGILWPNDAIGTPYASFFGVYGAVFLSLAIMYPIRVLRLLIHSGLFSVLAFLVVELLVLVVNMAPVMAEFPVPNIVLVGGAPVAIAGMFYLFDRLVNKINHMAPFSVIDFNQLMAIIAALQPITRWAELQQVLLQYPIFKSPNHRLHLWGINHEQVCSVVSAESPSLDPDILMFLQYKGSVNIKDEKSLLTNYFQSPFHTHVRLLLTFMQTHHLVYLTLVQKSYQMVGVLGVSFNDSRHEILTYDLDQLTACTRALSHTLSNVIFFSQQLTQQTLLSSINMSATMFDSPIDDNRYYAMIRTMLSAIIPGIKCYALLSANDTSHVYEQTLIMADSDFSPKISIHVDHIHALMGGRMYAKCSIDQSSLPNDIQQLMVSANMPQLLLIRLNELEGSPVFMLFLDSNMDVLDYRISFCHMFLRQSDIFYQYQKDCDQFHQLEVFLKQLLDQLPIGIVIASTHHDILYMNQKMLDQSGQVVMDITPSTAPIVLLPCIDHAISFVAQNGKQYNEKVPINDQGDNALHSLFAFQVGDATNKCIVVALTNIQQSKELIDQMHQTNRLAMMSKIAKGISYELTKPVAQLILGVEKIDDEWHCPGFQTFFLTDIVPQVDRINLLCQSLLRLSRSNKESLANVYLPELLDHVYRLIAGDLRYSTQTFYIGDVPPVNVVIDQVMAMQVLMNLMIFCLKTLAKKNSELSLTMDVSEDHFLMITISINDYLSAMRSSVETIKDQLELSIVNQIVMNQNGTFDTFSDEKSVRFHLALPIQRVGQETLQPV